MILLLRIKKSGKKYAVGFYSLSSLEMILVLLVKVIAIYIQDPILEIRKLGF